MKKKYITVDDIKYQLANLRQLTFEVTMLVICVVSIVRMVNFIMIMISVKIAQLVCPLL